MGACASRIKVLKNSNDATPPPVTKEEAAAAVEEEVKAKDEGLVVAAAGDEAKNQLHGQILIQENEGHKGPCKASGESEQEDAGPRENKSFKSHEAAAEAEKIEEKTIQISNLGTVEDKPVVELVKAVEFEGNEESAAGKKPEANKIENTR